jgi:hypothetical protein
VAVFNEILTGALNQILARRLGVQTGGGAVAPSIAPEIIATLPLEVDRPEWGFLSGERHAAATTGVSAMAALNSVVALTNPVNSNVVAVVEFVRAEMAAGSTLAWYVVPNLGFSTGTIAANTLLDTRWTIGNSASRAACLLTATNAGALPPNAAFTVQSASTISDWSQPVILCPGTALVLAAVTVNVGITRVAMKWRERAAVSGELG